MTIDLNGIRLRNRLLTSASLLGYGASKRRLILYGLSPIAQWVPLERFGAVTEANNTVTLSNNGSLVGTTTADGTGHWSVNNIALTDGANYSFTATAADAANNTSGPSNALAFHDDRTPPAAPVITTTAPAQDNAASISIAGTAEANSTVTLSNNGSLVGTTTAYGTGHWSVNNIALTDGANHSFTATATDAANNTSGPSNALAFHDDRTRRRRR